MTDSWYYKLFGQEFGPVSFENLYQLARDSAIGPSDEVKDGDQGEWVPVRTIVGLFPDDQTQDPGSAENVAGEASPAAGKPADDSDAWRYRVNGREFGPISFEELFELAGSSVIGPQDEIRAARTRDWISADSIVGLFPETEPDSDAGDSAPGGKDTVDAVAAATTADSAESSSERDDGQPTYFCRVFGQELGPMPLDDLKSMIQQGELSAGDQVKIGVVGEWMPVGVFQERSSAFGGGSAVAEGGVAAAAEVRQAAPDASAHESTGDDLPADADPEAIIDAVLAAEPEESKAAAAPRPASRAAAAAVPGSPSLKPPASTTPAASLRSTSPPPTSPPPTSPPASSKPPTSKPSPPVQPWKPPTAAPAPKPQPTGRSGPSVGIGSLFSGVSWNPKVLIAVGVVVLLVAFPLIYFTVFGSASHRRDQAYYDTLVGLRDEFRQLRQNNGSPAEWQALTDKVEAVTEPMLKDLEKRAGVKKPVAQKLLFAARDFLPKMLQSARTEPNEFEEDFDTHMENVRKLLGGE